ncbi:MAG TPA: DUF4091 domain-containing protein [Anaerolineae bacterium]|nr:DUF4091 domain-containing protein [Anaerolineae bacterium]
MDFAAADAEMTPYLDRGLALFTVPDAWDSDEERYVFRDSDGRFYVAAAFDDPTFVDKAGQYYAALRDHYIAQGWFDEALVFPTDETLWVADEPLHNGPAGFQRLRDWSQLIKTADPAFRITAASVLPIPPGPPERGWVDLTGFIDDWNVIADDVDADPALWRTRQALGETVSYYLNDYGDFIDYQATLHRALAWHAFVHDAHSIAGWAAAAWIDSDLVPHNPWTTSFEGVYGHGGGAFFWPGHHIGGDPDENVDGPLPSLRLKLAREAVEDADYLTLLADRISDAYAHDLAQSLIPGDLFHTYLAPDDLYAQRDWLGDLLAGEITITLTTLTGAVTDAATGEPVEGALIRAAHTAARTASDGRYTLTLAGDEARLTVSHPRYLARAFAPAAPTLDMVLTPRPVEALPLFSFETASELEPWEFTGVVSVARVADHATAGDYALRVTFDDDPTQEAEMGAWQFTPSDWRGYTALEFDVYNEGDYYTYLQVGIADSGQGWYPQTDGNITLLPNSASHLSIPIAAIAHDVDLSAIAWLSILPETVTEETDYTGETRLWPVGQRTLYVDDIRLVRVSEYETWLPLIRR